MAAVTRMRRNFSLNWKNRKDFENVVHSYESDVEQADIDDMMEILQYKLTDTVEADAEYLDGSAPNLGTRVVRGPEWNSGNQDKGGPGTVVRHSRKQGHVIVEWDYTRIRGEYSYQVENRQIVTSQVQRILTDDDLIAPGCLVCRGDDWQWGFQDGGPENVGVVYDVQQSGLVHVRWPNGHSNWYRFGAEGMFDVQIWEPYDIPNGFAGSPTVFQPRETFLPPKPSKAQMVTSASSHKEEDPVYVIPDEDVQADLGGDEVSPSTTDLGGAEVSPSTAVKDEPQSNRPEAEMVTSAVSGPEMDRKHVLPPNDMSPSAPSASAPVSVPGPSFNQPTSLSDQTDLSIDHATIKIQRNKTHSLPVNSPELSPGESSRPSQTLSSGADSKEVYAEDVEWSWYNKNLNKWIAFSEACTKDLELEKQKNRKHSSKNVKIDGQWYRVFINTMKLQMVKSRESTPVRRAVIPRAIRGMRKERVEKYMKLLEKGKYKSSNIRLMVVGNDRVGKTSLCRNMLDEPNFGNIEGTDGIEVFVNSYQINLETCEKKKLGTTEHDIAMRKLASATVHGKAKKDQDDDIEIDVGKHTTEEEDSVPHFQQMSMDLPGSRSQTMTPMAPYSTLEDRFEQISINQDIKMTETAQPTKSNYVVSKTGEIIIPEYVRKDVDHILDEAGKLQSATDENTAYLSMWDFGGEKIFYDTHHIFLSNDAVYLLCFDVEKCETKKDFEPILFWLRSIATYSECNGKSKGPPIFLIGTHRDKLEGTEEEKQKKFEALCAKITSHSDVEPIQNQILDYFCVSNVIDQCDIDGKQKFEGIMKAIIKAARYQSQWQRDIPTKWLALEREIMKTKKKEKIKTFEEIVEMDRKMEVPIRDKEEIQMFLRYLHLMGYIIYFDEDVGLDGPHRYKDLTIIINPQWVIYAFRRLITNPKNIASRGCKRMVLWNSYVKDGQLTTPLIDDLWSKQEGDTEIEEFMPYKNHLLWVMERLGLLAPPVYHKSQTDCPVNLDYYIVPSMLSDVDPTWVEDLLASDLLVRPATLRLTLGGQFISLPVYHKLLAVCLTKFKLPTVLALPNKRQEDFSKADCIKKGFGCLEVTGAWKVILVYSNSAINISLFTYSDVNEVRAGIGVDVRVFLEETLVDVLRLQGQNIENLEFKYFLGHEVLEGKGQGQFKSKEDIEELSKDDRCYIGSDNHLKKADLKPWFCSDEEKDMPIPVPKFLRLDQQKLIPMPLHLTRISACISLKGDREKESFGFGLGLEKHHIDAILEENKGMKDQAYKMLCKWQELKRKGTIGDIVKGMKKYGLDCGFFYKKGKVFD
ncbi:uncharacterized protein [Argopecten irradians]|uniref:uncharacterized protein isoform X1 n=1 Tax=Argopecten irradians TaxID=31199 RepID=UPI003714CFB7